MIVSSLVLVVPEDGRVAARVEGWLVGVVVSSVSSVSSIVVPWVLAGVVTGVVVPSSEQRVAVVAKSKVFGLREIFTKDDLTNQSYLDSLLLVLLVLGQSRGEETESDDEELHDVSCDDPGGRLTSSLTWQPLYRQFQEIFQTI